MKKQFVKIYALGFLLFANPLLAQLKTDSTLLYTLKENERIIYLSEHRLLVNNTSIGHLLFLARPTGYFILFNSKEYGPYQNIQFTESNTGLLDWAVQQNGSWYQLLLDKGIQLGPYETVIDVYRSEEYQEFYRGTDYSGNHYGFRAKTGAGWFTVIDGKPHGPYKEEPDIGIPHFIHRNGTIRAALKGYDNDWRTGRSNSTGDSVVIENFKGTEYSLMNGVLKKNGQTVASNVVYFAEDKLRKNLLIVDKEKKVFLNGVPIDCPTPNISSYDNEYYCYKSDFIFDTGHAIIQSKPGESQEFTYYLTHKKKAIGPFNYAVLESLRFSLNGEHYAYNRATNIIVDEKIVHKRGFSLVHDPAKDCFSWLTVKGRSIYLHSLKP